VLAKLRDVTLKQSQMPTYYDIGPIPSENVTDFDGVEDS
jgi:hypothetical protein